ncbi:MAG: hypothetical protein K9J37_14590 [Saprospiraceae bacterium]|nr:hypothetical protein [Saprospiraceae bacterium]MCF8251135.1 hypothetical protein [Saprospiraceae bacterium]MCF8282953.1 hypothetical protein [Bacteroidales bacterium]MCF8312907.1 hypothetical protein [Saprospiraceae bacterium]MCF8441394.1 hypothetical protein [Saprospiraceae bacterium]
MNGQNIQNSIIECIREQIPKEKSIARELAGVLGLGINAVYKRIEGKTALTIEDLARILEYYQLPWHRIFRPEDNLLTIQFSGFSTQGSCKQYLLLLEQELMALQRDNMPEIWFLTVGLPDFHLFHFEELAHFQLYFWERITWGNADWQGKKFNLQQNGRQDLLPVTKRLVHLYASIPATEIWNEHILDSYLHQLVYAKESNLFEDPGDLSLILEKLHQLVDHLEQMAGQERRFPVGGSPSPTAASWHLHFNEIMRNNILLVVKTADGESFYAVMDNPNFIKSDDPAMLDYAKSLINTQLSRSFPLGKTGERSRGVFFEKLRFKIQVMIP